MYFGTKNYLKNNRYHTTKHILILSVNKMINIYFFYKKKRRDIYDITT